MCTLTSTEPFSSKTGENRVVREFECQFQANLNKLLINCHTQSEDI